MARARRSTTGGMGCPASAAAAAQVVEDLDLVGLAVLDEQARPSSGSSSWRTNGWSAATDVAIRASMAARSSGRQRPRQLEVVVEAVLDGRTDAQLRAGEQVHHRLGHDVRRRVAHRVEGIARAGVEQLLGRAALGRHEVDSSSRTASSRCCASSLIVADLPESEQPLVPRQDERPCLPRSHPPSPRARAVRALVAAITGDARAGSPAAHGWCVIVRRPPGLSAVARALWRSLIRARVPIDAFCIWWATLDSNQ